eukprot:CAMPEP_0197037880 /NCGR_PEP_ID=MMETSP1384-20130603/14985_1 /TAXON_ID=29189 /ORGANISM="Ammonia sp." /LENGTH=604 /DNA_ID=CAMNT_0042468257 /DNA_START=58 /DNA_END=1872 /DNA_ORIENTATION=+
MGLNCSKCFGPEHLLQQVSVRVVIVNQHQLVKDVTVHAMKSDDYKVANLCVDLIYALQRVHQPCSYNIHSISFKRSKSRLLAPSPSRNGTNKLMNEDQDAHRVFYADDEIYAKTDTERFDEMLKQSLKQKYHFEFKVSSIADVEIPVAIDCAFNPKYCDKFTMACRYSSSYCLIDLVDDVIKHLNTDFHQMLHGITYRNNVSIDFMHSFCDYTNELELPLTNWDIMDLHTLGIAFFVEQQKLNCPYMLTENNLYKTTDRFVCPIYLKLMNRAECAKMDEQERHKLLRHLCEFNHFRNDSELLARDECPYLADKCPSFQRLGTDNKLALNVQDRIHLLLYKHEPRIQRLLRLNKTTFKFIGNKHWRQNNQYNPVYKASNKDKLKYEYAAKQGFLNALQEEVLHNECEDDLCDGEIMRLVDEKLHCSYHQSLPSQYKLNTAEMLAMMLYCNGSQCVYDMIDTQLLGNYEKWKWLDKSLFDAIGKLAYAQYGSYKIYASIDGKKYTQKDIVFKRGYIASYLHCSKIKDIAISGGIHDKFGGILVEFHKSFISKHNKCCNISWISSFPDEHEVVMQRSTSCYNTIYKCTVMGQNDQRELVQIISVREK